MQPNAAFVPVDFENGSLARSLSVAGFDRSRPALVSWLGVTMYLTAAAIGQVLAEVASFAAWTQIIADYMLQVGLRDATGNAYAEQVMPVATQRGEPWLTFWSPQEASALLASHGFGQIRHIAQADIGGPALWQRTDSLRPVDRFRIAHATL